MPIKFSIDHDSQVPPFEQVKASVREAISQGSVTAGEKLPAIRALAGQLSLAVNTVARSYRELEDEGFVTTHGRSGTSINPRAIGPAIALEQFAHAYVTQAQSLGVSVEEAVRAVHAVWRSA